MALAQIFSYSFATLFLKGDERFLVIQFSAGKLTNFPGSHLEDHPSYVFSNPICQPWKDHGKVALLKGTKTSHGH